MSDRGLFSFVYFLKCLEIMSSNEVGGTNYLYEYRMTKIIVSNFEFLADVSEIVNLRENVLCNDIIIINENCREVVRPFMR